MKHQLRETEDDQTSKGELTCAALAMILALGAVISSLVLEPRPIGELLIVVGGGMGILLAAIVLTRFWQRKLGLIPTRSKNDSPRSAELEQ